MNIEDPIAIIQVLASTGIGGVIAGVVIWWKRIDDKNVNARERQYAVELAAMLGRQENYSRDLVDVIKDNTAAMTALMERLGPRENPTRRR